jgi:hypothetical protein
MLCSQIDVLPTLAWLSGTPVKNSAMGRNILSIGDSNKVAAFIFDNDMNAFGIISKGYYYRKDNNTGKENFFPLDAAGMEMKAVLTDSSKEYLRRLATGYYETARYLLLNNRRP